MKTTRTYALQIIGVILCSLLFAPAHAQTKAAKEKNKKDNTIPLTADRFDSTPGAAEFVAYKERQSMKVLTDAIVVLKNFNFTNGTIDYDFEPIDPRFASIYFRYQNKDESELFYFRTGRAGVLNSEDGIQYAPIIKGINLWDVLYNYQTHADFKKEQWNHIRLVVNGKQMRAYVNDMSKPALQVFQLEGDVATGTLAFGGQGVISNLSVDAASVEDLPAIAGVDASESDRRYLRKWDISSPIDMAEGIEFSYAYLPNKDTKWEPIASERNGLINITRKRGGNKGRRLVWLKTTIESDVKQIKKLDLGFSDDVWIFLNGRMLYEDKNGYFQLTIKDPQGRLSLENAMIELPLNEGANEIIIGVANDFYGWGIVARLKSLEGIR